MDILKYGKGLGEPSWVKKCKACGSKLVYNINDIKCDTNCKLYIVCPVCGDYIKVGLFRKEYNPNKHGELITPEEEKRKIGF